MVTNDGIAAQDIIILTSRLRKSSALWRFGALGNFRLTDSWPPGPNEVYCTSVYQFKGLESPVIVLAEIYPSSQQDMEAVLYVGCSRARHHLIVLAGSGLPEDIRARLKDPEFRVSALRDDEPPF